MNTSELKVFLAINNYKNISHAANALFLSQSSVSYKLSMLEKEIGATLFYRQKGHSSVVLSPAGEKFLPICQKMIELKEDACCLNQFGTKIQIKIISVDSINCYSLINFYQQHMTSHPNTELTIMSGHTEEIHKMIDNKLADIGITNTKSPYPDVSSEILFQEHYVILKKKEGNETLSSPIDPCSLNIADAIVQNFDYGVYQWYDAMFPNTPRTVISEISGITASLLTTSQNWAVMPYSVALHFQQQRAYRLFDLTTPPAPRIAYINMHRKPRHYNEKEIELFKKSLNEYILNTFS